MQTEGDAIRAWNELFQNINDPKLVKERLGQIQRINARGADLQKLNVDQIRANYGAEPLDYTSYTNRPGAIGEQNNRQSTSTSARRRIYDPNTKTFR